MMPRQMKMSLCSLFVLLTLQSCTTTVSHRVIQICRLYCDTRGGLHQIVIDRFKGNGCHCRSSHLLWLNMGEEGTFEDIKDLGDEYQEFRNLGQENAPY